MTSTQFFEHERHAPDRKYVTIILLACISVGLSLFCYAFFVERIPPGAVGVVVNMMGSDQGVEPEELHTGLHIVAPWKSVYQFPTFEQNHVWDHERRMVFQSAEGLVVSADVGLTYHLQPDKIYLLFQKYRRGMDEITDIFVRNNVRDAINRCAGKLKIEDLYGSEKDAFFDAVQAMVSKELDPLGITISRIYLIGRLHFPENVVAALNAKIEATQRAQQRENELREAQAQAQKVIATSHGQAEALLIGAKAEAEANHILSKSVTPELIKWQAVQKWDGELPSVVSEGAILNMVGK